MRRKHFSAFLKLVAARPILRAVRDHLSAVTLELGAGRAKVPWNTLPATSVLGEMLDATQEAARRELDLAEAELAVLKQELVLQRLLDTGEPTEEARAALARLRDVVAQLSASGSPDVEIAGEAA